MKSWWTLVLLAAASAGAHAQPAGIAPNPFETIESCPPLLDAASSDRGNSRFTGNHKFDNFINWMSNPLQNIDPRAVTAVYPIFGSAWMQNTAPVPNGDFQLYGPAITVALSERFAVGINQGGYAYAQFSRNPGQLAALTGLDPAGRFADARDRGHRTGFLNVGGFFQYTAIEDVERQFILSAGLRWEVPIGSYEMFQGHGPVHLAPYVTAGKEVGKFHALATTGFNFPAGPGNDTSEVFYGNVHLDRQCFGWLYPLVEVNALYHATSVPVGLDTRRGFIDFGNYESTGNVVTLAVGANAVLIPARLELGAVYTTVIASQRDFSTDALLVKMTLRY